MAKDKDRKDFKDTKFGQFVKRAGQIVPDVLDVAVKVASGDISGAVAEVGEKIRGAALRNEEAKKLLMEYQQIEWAFEKEMEEYAVRDREGARNMRTAIAATGRFDWEHFIVTMVFLIAFIGIIVAIVYIPIPADKAALFHQMVGMVEGVVLSIAAFHFGTTRSSRKKDDTISKMIG